MADGKVEIETSIDNKKLDKDVKQTEKKLNGLQKIVDKLNKVGAKNSGLASTLIAVKSGADLAIGGLKQVVDVAKKYIQVLSDANDAYEVQIKAENALQRASENNPYLNDESVRKLKRYASELQSISNFGDEGTIDIMAQLASTGRTEAEIMKIMGAAADYASATHTDLASAAQTLNATYSGMAGTLGRQIGELKDLTEEQLKNGDAIDIIAKKYQGFAKEAVDAGVQSKNAFGDFMECVGRIVNPGQEAFFGFLTSFWNKMAEKATAFADYLEKLNQTFFLGGAYRDSKSYVKSLNEELKTTKKGEESRYMQDNVELLADKEIENIKVYLETRKKLNENEKEFIALLEKEQKHRERVKQQSIDYSNAMNKWKGASKGELEERLKVVSTNGAEGTLKEVTVIRELLAEIAKEEERARKEEEARINQLASSAIANYKEKIALAQKEIDLKRELGEEITKEAELSTMLATKQRAGLEMLNEAQGTITTNNPFFKQIQEDINADAKELEALIATQKDYEELTKHFADVIKEETAPAWREYYDVLDSLQNQFDNIKDRLPIDKVEELSAKLAKARKQIHDSLAVPDVDESIQAKYDEQIKLAKEMRDETERLTQEIARIEEEARLASLNGEQMLADQKLAIIEDYNMRKAELIQQATQIEKQAYQEQQTAIYASYQNKVETVTGYTRQICDIVTQASNFMLQIAQNQATAKQAQIEAQYRKGEMREEEYNEAITNAKRKAAREQYKIQMVQWIASCLQATANIAEGVTKCLASGPAGIPQAVLVGASGAIALASVVASKPIPPNFTTGGIVGGSSYHGDNIATNLNSKEMVMNQAQQKGLWDFINGGSQSNGGGVNIQINNTASNMVEAEPKIDQNKITLLIKAKVKEGLKNGDFDSELNTAQQGMGGDYLGI